METIYQYYRTIWYTYADHRITGYPLMGSPIPVISIVSIYWLIIKKGPQWMANREPYNIKTFIQAYNIFQIVACGWLGYRCFKLMYEGDLMCMVHTTESDHDMRFVFLTWCYILLKVVDLMDTLFFVLRKKFQLLTTLHTYHHTMMVVLTTFVGRYFPAGEMSMLGALNSCVHSVMYFYYFYCLYSNSRQNIWWKKYITQMQLGQFCILFVYFSWKLFQTGCPYPKYLVVLGLTQVMAMLWMFGSYYYSAFIKAKPKEVNNNMDAKRMKSK